MREEQVLQRPTVDPQAAASGGQEQTDSQPTEEGVIKFNPTAKFQDPDNPEQVIEGNILKTRLNMGKLASKFQSERDTALTRAQQLAQEIAKRDQQVADLQKQIAAKQQEETTLNTLKRLGIKPESQDAGNGGSDWLTGDEQPQLTQQQILQELGSIENRLSQKAQEEVAKTLERLDYERTINQQSQQRVNSYVNRARQANEAQLRSELPDIPDQDISQIVLLNQAARALEMRAMEAVKEGDEDTAEEAYLKAEGNAAEAARLRAQATLRQQDLAAQKEIEQQTEMFAPGGTVFRELEEKNQKRSFNKADAKKLAQEHIADAKEYEKQRRRLLAQ